MTSRLCRNPYLRILPNYLDGSEPFLVEDIDTRDTFKLHNSTFLDLLDQVVPRSYDDILEQHHLVRTKRIN